MQIQKENISFKHFLSRVLPQMRGQKTSKDSQKDGGESYPTQTGEHSILETGHGRRNTRRYIESFTRRLQSSFQNKGSMGRVLQTTTRIEETRAVREKAERETARSIEIVRIAKDKGYQFWTDMMLSIEGDAYYSLRMPHAVRDESQSLDYFIGFQAGRLAVVEDLRELVQTAEIFLKRESERENERLRRKQSQGKS